MESTKPISEKPLRRRAYGSIGHLPGSRTGPGDYTINQGQARILTEKTRDGADFVIVTEKLDGTNVAAAKIGGKIVPLVRAGYHARTSPYEMHHIFADWVDRHADRFSNVLAEGQRVCGEWLAQAHGTRYVLLHEPFVAFDIMEGEKRLKSRMFYDACHEGMLTTAKVIHMDWKPLSIIDAMRMLGPTGFHGAVDQCEGAVWRVERNGEVDFLAKYVKPGKADGCFIKGFGATEEVWNWRP